MKRRFIIKTIALSVIAILFLLGAEQCCKPTTPTLDITSVWTNIEAHVDFDGGANDFHIILDNIDSSQVSTLWFNPMVSGSGLTNSGWAQFGSGILVSWEFAPKVDYCDMLGFCIFYSYDLDVKPVIAWWTYRTSPSLPVAILSFPLQTWEIAQDTVIVDIVWNPDPPIEGELAELGLEDAQDTRGDIVIGRSWAFSEKLFELPELRWDNEEFAKLKWNELDEERISKDARADLNITGFNTKRHKSVLVKYWVRRAGSDDIISRFINQAEIVEAKPEEKPE